MMLAAPQRRLASSLVDPLPIVSRGELPLGAIRLWKSRPATWKTLPIVAGGSLLVVGSFVWVPMAIWLGWKKCKTRRRRIIYVLVLCVVLSWPARRWEAVVRHGLWSRFVEYFAVEVVADDPLPKDPSVLYAVIPHGTFPFGVGVLSLGPLNRIFNKVRPVVASAVLRFPGFGQLISSIGGIDARPREVSKAIQEGSSVSICPGGIAEMFWGYPKEGCLPREEYAFLRSRKGFIRMAMKHGVPVVPVYCFGNTHAMHKAKTPWILEALSRLLKTSLILTWGRWGLPIPYRVPLLYAVGKPLRLLQADNPTPAQVEAAHAQFLEALSDLFDRYKCYYGWGNKTLRIV